MNKRTTGTKKEKEAAEFLRKQGVLLLARNFRCRQGEIDLIGIHQGILVFFEVKYRRSEEKGLPEEAVGEQKQRKICKCSDYFRVRNQIYFSMQVRYDVIAILSKEIKWIQNAFPYHYAGNGYHF